MIQRGLGTDTIIEGSNEIIRVEGELRQGVNVAMSPELFEEYRTGRRCLRCHGVQDEAMPEVCKSRDLTGSWRCGFRIRDDQLRYLENEHKGEQRYGPSPDDDYDYERKTWAKKTGIWLPGDN